MSNPALCPRCKEVLPVNVTMGLCPVCLLAQGMEEESLSLSYSGGAGASARWSEDVSPRSVLKIFKSAIGDVPSVLLSDTEPGVDSPVVRPSSPEMPAERGRYQLLGEIGRGGMGAVFKGRDPDLGRDLAVKVLLEEHQGDSDLIRRFIEEAQIGGQLQHPGIVPVYELGSINDRRPYFTMKLVKGRTLATLMHERVDPVHDLPRFLAIFEQVCQPMAYAHARGVIHRDLKPSNVMVGPFGEVQVMDWGLAKVLPKDGPKKDPVAPPPHQTIVATVRSKGEIGSSQAGSVLGTPAYMAPEQARGETEAIDRRADVFALGSILCEILTGEPAFSGGSSDDIMRAARRADTAAALSRLEECGAEPELLALARDCLAALAKDRPADAGAVAGRMTAYLAGVQERLREAGLARAAESARAHAALAKASAERQARRMTAALAATVLLAVVLGGAGWRGFENERQERARKVAGRVNEARQKAIRLFGLAQGAAATDARPWERAADAAEKAVALLDSDVEPELRKQVEDLAAEAAAGRQQAEAAAGAADSDRQLMERLLEIRIAEADDRGGWLTDTAYTDAFRKAGLDVAAAEEAAQRIRARPPEVATTLAISVDDWAAIRRDRQKNRASAAALSALAGALDPDPWRQSLRRALDLEDHAARRAALRVLATNAPYDTLGPISLDLLGRALKDAGDAAEAEGVLRRAQERHPGDVWVNYDLARTLEKLARREDAIRFYTAARAIRPDTAHELAHALGSKGEREEEIAIFKDLKRLRPGSGRHLGCLGRALLEQDRSREATLALEEAAAANREAIRSRPLDAYPYFSLGFALVKQGNTADAIVEYVKAIKLQPNDATFHDNLCEAMYMEGKLDEAIEEHRKAVALQPDFANAYNTLGRILTELKGDHRAAAAAFREAIKLQPDFAPFRVNLGLALEKLDELDTAITEYRRAIELNRSLADPHMGLGEIYEFQGKRAEAIVEYRTATGLGRNRADAHNLLASILAKAQHGTVQERREALDSARRAVVLAPKDGDYHATLALALFRAGDWDESIAAAQASNKLTKGMEASNWFILAMALWRKGEKDRSRSFFEQAVSWTTKHDPKDANLLAFWREAALLRGDPGPDSASLPDNPGAPGDRPPAGDFSVLRSAR
jgi:eukaryotic-like serine/threonine-protein kinase